MKLRTENQEPKTENSRAGFTLFEVLIAATILGILLVGALLTINPGEQFKKARNRERKAHVNVIIGAIGEHLAANRGSWNCSSGSIPTSTMNMGNATGSYHIAPCLIPLYLPTLPYDPSASGTHYSSTTDYDTGYHVFRNVTSGRITISAPSAELGEVIEVTR